ncbi:MAG: hypothetical protein CMN93_06400 [Synechococcus sp. CPC35]|nr:hypothetical protein [Synechococcus sp. CPC35]
MQLFLIPKVPLRKRRNIIIRLQTSISGNNNLIKTMFQKSAFYNPTGQPWSISKHLMTNHSLIGRKARKNVINIIKSGSATCFNQFLKMTQHRRLWEGKREQTAAL